MRLSFDFEKHFPRVLESISSVNSFLVQKKFPSEYKWKHPKYLNGVEQKTSQKVWNGWHLQENFLEVNNYIVLFVLEIWSFHIHWQQNILLLHTCIPSNFDTFLHQVFRTKFINTLKVKYLNTLKVVFPPVWHFIAQLLSLDVAKKIIHFCVFASLLPI